MMHAGLDAWTSWGDCCVPGIVACHHGTNVPPEDVSATKTWSVYLVSGCSSGTLIPAAGRWRSFLGASSRPLTTPGNTCEPWDSPLQAVLGEPRSLSAHDELVGLRAQLQCRPRADQEVTSQLDIV